MNRQEMVNLTHRKLGRKDQTRANSEQDSSSTRKPDALSPEMENLRFSKHRYMGKICQCLQKKLGRSALDATFSIESHKTNVLIWRMFMASSMKAAIHLGPDFLRNSGIYLNTRFENIENVFNIIQKFIKEHSEEILNVRGLEYTLPSWTRSVLANDQAVKWAKANVVSALTPFFVLVGWKTVQEPQKESGKAKLKISGCIHHIKMLWESMERQLNLSGFFPGFSTSSSFQEIQKDLEEKNIEPENFQDRIIFMSMFNDILWKTGDENCISNAEKVKNYAKNLTRTLDFSGSRVGREMLWRISRSKRTVGSHSPKNGTAIQRNRSPYLHKYQCFESWDLEAEKR